MPPKNEGGFLGFFGSAWLRNLQASFTTSARHTLFGNSLSLCLSAVPSIQDPLRASTQIGMYVCTLKHAAHGCLCAASRLVHVSFRS